MKTIAVLGAGSGLGSHIGLEFGARGFDVVLMARREKPLQELMKEFKVKGINSGYRCLDCADNEAIRSVLSEVIQEYGGIDVLVYNTAVLQNGRPSVLSPEELVRRYQVDVAGALCACQTVIPDMRKKGNGAILFTGGGLAFNPSVDYASVSIHKAALRILAETLHEELAKDGIYAGIVNIKGNIGSNEYYRPENIAALFYELYEKREGFEITY